jgi:addiction module RelE/StbE family toxin
VRGIIKTRSFEKTFRKLSKQDQDSVIEVIELFLNNSKDSSLYNHKLSGKLKNHFALKAGYDLRIIYRFESNKMIVVFVTVGKHDEVYR